MLFSKQPRIEEMLVMILASHPQSSAKELHKLVGKNFQQISLQGVYQELKKLEAQGVILKHKKRYTLGLHWVLELTSFADALYDRHTEADVLEQLPEEGESAKKWKFHSLSAVVPFWTHMVLCMAQQSNERLCYEYMDHIWFHLVSSAVESKFLGAMQNLQLQHYLVVGSDTYLDRMYKDEVSTGDLTLFYGRRIFPESKEHYLTCIGPFVLRVKAKESFLKRIDEFYESIPSGASFHAGKLTDFITERTSLTLTVENNPKAANRIRKSFIQILELPKE